jgi:hypothetical protein
LIFEGRNTINVGTIELRDRIISPMRNALNFLFNKMSSINIIGVATINKGKVSNPMKNNLDGVQIILLK